MVKILTRITRRLSINVSHCFFKWTITVALIHYSKIHENASIHKPKSSQWYETVKKYTYVLNKTKCKWWMTYTHQRESIYNIGCNQQAVNQLQLYPLWWNIQQLNQGSVYREEYLQADSCNFLKDSTMKNKKNADVSETQKLTKIRTLRTKYWRLFALQMLP